jgi:hypothetical protein
MGQWLSTWSARAFTLDLRSLALFRIGLGIAIIADALVRSMDIEAFYTDVGVRPRGDVMGWMLSQPSLHLLSGDVWFQAVLMVLTMIAGVAVMVGWHTRIAMVVAWALVLSVQNRNNAVNSGADSVLIAACMFGCLMPLGSRLSLDARRPSPPDLGTVYSMATAALVLQVVIIYVFNVVNKYGGTWWNGTAVLAALHLDQHATPIGLWIRAKASWLSPPLTFGTLLIEFSALLLVVPVAVARIRTGLVVAFWAMHIGMAVCLYLGWFAPNCMVLWLAMIPSAAWDQRPLRWLSRFTATWTTTDAATPLTTPIRRVWRLAMVLLPAWLIATQLSLNVWKVFEATPPRLMAAPARAIGNDQLWRLFSKNPSPHDGWSIVTGTLANGDRVDLLNGNMVTDDKPAVVSHIYRNSRWRRFMMNNSVEEAGGSRKRHAAWLCHHWNAAHDDQQRLVTIDMKFMLEMTRRDFRLDPKVVPEDRGHFPCKP